MPNAECNIYFHFNLFSFIYYIFAFDNNLKYIFVNFDICLYLFSIFAGLSTLVKRLNVLNHSTVYYMLDGNDIGDSGSNSDMAHQLSTAYQKQIILWPCPHMKVRIVFD